MISEPHHRPHPKNARHGFIDWLQTKDLNQYTLPVYSSFAINKEFTLVRWTDGRFVLHHNTFAECINRIVPLYYVTMIQDLQKHIDRTSEYIITIMNKCMDAFIKKKKKKKPFGIIGQEF